MNTFDTIRARLSGVVPALVSPHDGKDNFCTESFERHINFVYSQGVNGIYICGATGEGYSMRFEERKRAAEVAVQQSRGKGIVISHVGTQCTRDAAELAEHAAKCGVDAVASIPPLAKTQTELVAYYREIARVSSLPTLVYHIPILTGRNLTIEELVELTEIEGVAGLKFTDSNLFLMRRLLNVHPETVIFSGFDELLYPALVYGAKGGIGTWYNVVPNAFVALHEAVKMGDHARAFEWQDRIIRLADIGWRFGIAKTVELLLRRRGTVKHAFRHPYTPFGDRDARMVDAKLNAILQDIEPLPANP